MMKSHWFMTICLAALASVSVGCATTAIDASTIQAADYGAYPANYELLVKEHFQGTLKDPYSAKYRFSEPYKAYLREAPAAGGEPSLFGYIVDVGLNAKNSYGAYIGENNYRIFIRNGVVVTQVAPNVWFGEPWYK